MDAIENDNENKEKIMLKKKTKYVSIILRLMEHDWA